MSKQSRVTEAAHKRDRQHLQAALRGLPPFLSTIAEGTLRTRRTACEIYLNTVPEFDFADHQKRSHNVSLDRRFWYARGFAGTGYTVGNVRANVRRCLGQVILDASAFRNSGMPIYVILQTLRHFDNGYLYDHEMVFTIDVGLGLCDAAKAQMCASKQ